MKIFYFTATGNSLTVAKHIGGELISIPQIIDTENLEFSDDVIGIVFPIYSLNFPNMVKKFLERAKLKADYTFIAATCGAFAGVTLIDAQELAKENGYRFDYLTTISMLDNCLPQWEMETEKKKAEKKNIEENLKRIVCDINNRKVTEKIPTPGGKFMSWFSRTFFPIGDGYASKYIIDDKCGLCGTCAKVCPAGNILVSEKVVFKNSCEACQACIHACPKHAIHLKHERSNARWRNPEVSLNEIIAANNMQKK
ncbi:MAG: EFR1 family ferrodoxin [Methanocorpusculum sp.]|nr:EFR1 family ferrodoxin [Methanocorpusculum sp.]